LKEQTSISPPFKAASSMPEYNKEAIQHDNKEATRLSIQFKLTVGATDDPLEHEADTMADKVMRMPEQNFIQRKCAQCEEEEKAQHKPVESFIQKKCAHCEEEEKAQRKPIASFIQKKHSSINNNTVAADSISNQIQSTKGNGNSISSSTKSFMESRFGADFSNVKIHTGNYAVQLSKDLNAQAFTVGNNIYFNEGKYQPQSDTGKHLLAHELTHTIQQGGSSLNENVIQREVERVSVTTEQNVLSRIKPIENEFKDKSPKMANLLRLGKLGLKEFNPGAPGAAGPTNAFVYTCRCGWIDLGHFFTSAEAAYSIAFSKQFNIQVNGKPYNLDDILSKGLDKSEPELEALINTVPGKQGKAILKRVRELVKSGNPAALALALGYATEFYQQAAKLVADQMDNVPTQLEGEQRSAFTIEDLSSDCYGSDTGYKIWNAVPATAKFENTTLIHDTVQKLFKDCIAVTLTEDDKDKMMEETTPGSVKHIAGKDPRGVPVQDQNMDSPNLLKTAPAVCKNTSPLFCNLGKDSPAPGAPLSEITLNISGKEKTITATLPAGSKWLDSKNLPGTAIIKIGADGKVAAVGKVNIPGIGVMDMSMLTNLNFGELIRGEVPEIDLGMRSGAVNMEGKLSISYDGLERMKKGPLGDEVKKFEAILKSDKFNSAVKDLMNEKITAGEFKDLVIALVKEKYPEGMTAAVRNFAEQFAIDVIIHTKLNFFGVTSFNGIPVATSLFQKRDPVRILGNDAPVFRYAQGGIQLPYSLRASVEKQFGGVLGYSEDWLIGDFRSGGPGIRAGFTAGLGLPQAELYFEGHASATSDTGFGMELGFHLSPLRLGPREPAKPSTLFDFRRVPENILKGPAWDEDTRVGPASAYFKIGTKKLNLNLTYGMSPDGVQEVWLTLKGTHTIADSK
jgi:hypothetical protein